MTARKFEIGGTSNYPGAVALGETLELVNEIGIENIQSRVEELSAYCMEQLESIGATIITHKDPGCRAGIVIARIYEDLNTERAILKNLHAQNIFIAITTRILIRWLQHLRKKSKRLAAHLTISAPGKLEDNYGKA